jgi:dephospho-CoA kinase
VNHGTGGTGDGGAAGESMGRAGTEEGGRAHGAAPRAGEAEPLPRSSHGTDEKPSPGVPLPVVGVAGGCCAGKDQVTAWLLQRGWHEINVDRIGHEALAANHTQIVAAFGPTILDERGTIDRRSLGTVVFSDQKQLGRLESIVHPWMRAAVEEEITSWRTAAVASEAWNGGNEGDGGSHDESPHGLVINAAILFHMGLDEFCDTIILVTAPLITRIRRARERDRLGFRDICRRLWTQRHLNTQARAATADTIIVENGRSLESLYRQLDEHPQLQ